VNVDLPTLTAILAMAAVTYATRVAGFALVRRLELTGRAQLALEAVPGAVLVALVAPAMLAHGPADALAGAGTVLAAWRLPVLWVVVVGVVSAGVLRGLLG
jgi:branched chain amino acid efflux pump